MEKTQPLTEWKLKMNCLQEYKTIVFDCDGVILNSNKVKTQAFYEACEVYGTDAANRLVNYHVMNGGVSRYKKFEYFCKDILGKDVFDQELSSLLDVYARKVVNGLLSCEITPYLQELKEKTKHCVWYVVSGGDQKELREVFKLRDIMNYFEGGVFGSPDTKEDILIREMNNQLELPALFIGDSKYDFLAASSSGLDFVFLSGWSEFKEYKEFFQYERVSICNDLGCL